MDFDDVKELIPYWEEIVTQPRIKDVIRTGTPVDIYTLTKEELKDICLRLNLPDNVVAYLFGVSKKEVTRLRRKNGVLITKQSFREVTEESLATYMQGLKEE